LKKLALLILFFVTAFVVTGFLLPARVHVERSLLIDRPVTMMFELLNGYQHYEHYSPWVGRDPNARFTASGPKSGVGARLSWMGDPQLVGSGWQEIVSSTPYENISIRLDFDVQGVADTGFNLEARGESTDVTWYFDSDLTEDVNLVDSFLARYFGLLFDRWVGGDFEEGLAKLKTYAESLPVSEFSPLEIGTSHVASQPVLLVTAATGVEDPANVPMAMRQAYEEISDFMNQAGVTMTGQPMAITRTLEDGRHEYDAAIPVDFVPVNLEGNVRGGQSPGGPAVRAVHRGSYQQLPSTYEKLAAYLSAHGHVGSSVSWEHYLTDPAVTPPQDMVTHVYIMLAGPAATALD
jgi:effector-binding domain-containing protein